MNPRNQTMLEQITQIHTTEMTEISAKQWDFVTRENLTAKEAVEFLKNGMQVRTFKENVAEIYGSEDFEKQLIDQLYQIKSRLDNKEIQPDSIRKKVRNWVNGKNFPTDREEIFQICFALNLNLEQSEKMLTRLTEQGIHYRNGKETIYAYCLKYGVAYENAVQMAEEFLNRKKGNESYNDPATQMIKAEFQKVRGEEDLFAFMLNHRTQMGQSHNTAYAYFNKMLALLSGEVLEEEEKYSMEYIAENYLRLNVPLDKKTSGYSNVQKIVKKYWPGARSIKAMKSRSEDVNRKTLLLLYIVTGGVWDEEYDEADEEYLKPEEYLERHCKRMNQMLRECGMSRIDPRNMFDYLLLYCLRPEEERFMSERMTELMKEIFDTK